MHTPAILHQQQHQQKGIALILAMVITAIALTIAAALVLRQQVSIHLTSNLSALEQAYQYSLAIEEWAGVILKQDLNDNDVDSCDDAWATTIAPIPIPGGRLEGKLYDLQALLNINNVIGDKNERGEQTDNEQSVTRLKSLFSTLGLTNQLALSDAISDWIDEDDRDRSSLAENSYYKSLDPPYLAANGAIVSLSELRTIKGFNEQVPSATGEEDSEETETVYQKVRPYLTALPNPSISTNRLTQPATRTNTTAGTTKRTAINVNTAPAEVLLTIKGVTQAQVDNIIEDRQGGAFETVAGFVTSVGGGTNANPVDKTGIDVRSSYFLLKASVRINNVRLFINSVLFRDESRKKIHVLSREFNEISQNEVIDTCAINDEDTAGDDSIDTLTP